MEMKRNQTLLVLVLGMMSSAMGHRMLLDDDTTGTIVCNLPSVLPDLTTVLPDCIDLSTTGISTSCCTQIGTLQDGGTAASPVPDLGQVKAIDEYTVVSDLESCLCQFLTGLDALLPSLTVQCTNLLVDPCAT